MFQKGDREKVRAVSGKYGIDPKKHWPHHSGCDLPNELGTIMSLEARILELCRRAVAAGDDEAKCILAELKTALREHMLRSRRLLSAYPFVRVETPAFLEAQD